MSGILKVDLAQTGRKLKISLKKLTTAAILPVPVISSWLRFYFISVSPLTYVFVISWNLHQYDGERGWGCYL